MGLFRNNQVNKKILITFLHLIFFKLQYLTYLLLIATLKVKGFTKNLNQMVICSFVDKEYLKLNLASRSFTITDLFTSNKLGGA